MEDLIQMLVAVDNNLRNLFRDKDRLVGVDDWDNFLGCLMALGNIRNELQGMVEATTNTQEILAEE